MVAVGLNGRARHLDGRDERRLELQLYRDHSARRELYRYGPGHRHRGECQPRLVALQHDDRGESIAGHRRGERRPPHRTASSSSSSSRASSRCRSTGRLPRRRRSGLHGGTLLGTAAQRAGSWTYSDVPSSSKVANGTYVFSAVTTTGRGMSARRRRRSSSRSAGVATAATPRYASGTLSGQATAGSLVTIVDGDIVLGVWWPTVRQLAVHTDSVKGKHSIMAMPPVAPATRASCRGR